MVNIDKNIINDRNEYVIVQIYEYSFLIIIPHIIRNIKSKFENIIDIIDSTHCFVITSINNSCFELRLIIVESILFRELLSLLLLLLSLILSKCIDFINTSFCWDVNDAANLCSLYINNINIDTFNTACNPNIIANVMDNFLLLSTLNILNSVKFKFHEYINNDIYTEINIVCNIIITTKNNIIPLDTLYLYYKHIHIYT